MEIQREFELAIQKLSVAVKEDPENAPLLDRYIDILKRYIESGLLHGHLLYQQKTHYSVALAKSVELKPNRKDTYFKIIENDISMGDFHRAEEIAAFMQEKWPSDENVWFAGLRVCVETGNGRGKTLLIEKMKQAPIDWTMSGKERMSFWCGENLQKTSISPAHTTGKSFANEAV
jgi:hypothetical protein